MPLLFRQRTAGYILCLWHVQEDTPALAARCLPADAHRAEAFTSEKRRREWLAWRALLQDMLPGAFVDYTPGGAPELREERKYLSVSHAQDMVAVMVAHRPCGVDIEACTRNFSRVASKYIADAERQYLIPDAPHAYARLWCAKEALYKWAGIPGVNLREEVTVTFADPLPPAEPAPLPGSSSGADCFDEGVQPPVSPGDTGFAFAGTGQIGRMNGEVRGRRAVLRYLFLPGRCLAWCVDAEAEE